MLIRLLTPEDIESVWEVRLQALQNDPEAFGGTYEETIARGKENWHQRLQRMQESDDFFLGAFEAEKLVGFVLLHREEGLKARHRGMILSMYVAPEERGKGIGKALLIELIARARKIEGLEQLHLMVNADNTAAYNLYKSLGFETYGVIPNALKMHGQYWHEAEMLLFLIDPLASSKAPSHKDGEK